jgi:hypothetical protein
MNIEAKVFQTSSLCSIDIRTVSFEKLASSSNQKFHMKDSVCIWFERMWKSLGVWKSLFETLGLFVASTSTKIAAPCACGIRDT